jgi:hypothetical protein
MIRTLALVALAISVPVLAADKPKDEGLSPQGLLSVAKMAGACGIMDSLIHFQKTTKMNGGDDFVSRFWALEATRLGMTVQEYSSKCDSAVLAYDKLWKAGEESSK